MTMTEVGDSAGGTASQPSPGDSALALVAYDVVATQVSKVARFRSFNNNNRAPCMEARKCST